MLALIGIKDYRSIEIMESRSFDHLSKKAIQYNEWGNHYRNEIYNLKWGMDEAKDNREKLQTWLKVCENYSNIIKKSQKLSTPLFL